MQMRKQKILVLLLVPLLLYLAPLPFMPLMEPDEARYSAIPSAMNAAGNYVTPRLKGTVYLEKPPLAYWATAAAFRLFGENEFSARLFAALSAWGCIILVYRMGLFFHDARTGLYAAAVLTTFLYPFAIGRLNILDMPLAFLVSVATWWGFRHFSSPDKKKPRLYLLYLFSGFAFLTKGLVGIAFPFGIITLWLAVSGRGREIPALFSPVGIAVFSAVALPWIVLVQQANPDFLNFFFLQEHILRYASRIHGHYEPFYFYLPIVLAGTIPWCGFLPELFHVFGKNIGGLFNGAEKRLLLVWFGLIFLFYSFAASKLAPYIAPLFPPLALFSGHLFRKYDDAEGGGGDQAASRRRRAALIFQAVLFLALLLAPLFTPKHRWEWGDWWPWIVLPAALLLLLPILPEMTGRETGRRWFLATYLIFALFLASLTLPVSRYLAPYKSALPLSAAIEKNLPPGATLYQYGISLYGIDFYTGMRTPVVDDIGELRYGSEKLPAQEKERYFLDSASFFRLARENAGTYCATKKGESLERLKKEFPSLKILWHKNTYCLIVLIPGKGP